LSGTASTRPSGAASTGGGWFAASRRDANGFESALSPKREASLQPAAAAAISAAASMRAMAREPPGSGKRMTQPTPYATNQAS
jgi:hypothetical protein